MMLTPAQAAATWCPMVRAARAEIHPHNAADRKSINERTIIVSGCNTDALGKTRVPASCRCIADQCAMWRWGETKTELQRQVVERRVAFPDRAPEMRKFDEDVRVEVPHRGYCGLAGAPIIAGGAA